MRHFGNGRRETAGTHHVGRIDFATSRAPLNALVTGNVVMTLVSRAVRRARVKNRVEIAPVAAKGPSPRCQRGGNSPC
jgi:hypothetical protein